MGPHQNVVLEQREVHRQHDGTSRDDRPEAADTCRREQLDALRPRHHTDRYLALHVRQVDARPDRVAQFA